ncbi:MAG: CoA transferase [Myxococcota bacterium]
MEKAEFFREARSDLTGPLAGLRVLEAATTWAGPFCAALLGDFGADVIKVELPGGEVSRRLPPFLPGHDRPISAFNATVNRNKRSLTLDLRKAEGRDVFLRVAATCDFVVENFRPGTLAGWGLGYTDVRRVRPDVIYVSVSGFGQFGPDHDRAGYDPIAQARSGYISLNGSPDGDPVKSATWLADDLGGIHAALAALAAHAHRCRTGEGQHIDVALLDGLLATSNANPTLGALGVPLERWGNEFSFCAPASAFRCRDGWIYLGVLLDSHWQVLARLMGRPELADDPEFAVTAKRVANRAEVNRLVSEFCAEREAADVERVCAGAGLTAGAVRSFAESARDPHVQARDMLQSVAQEDGRPAPIIGPAAKFSRTPVKVRRGAPALGAHSDEILAEVGIDADARAKLRDAGIL